ncbi:hypothetical protein ACOMHN_065766 [Nucella lapillus]
MAASRLESEVEMSQYSDEAVSFPLDDVIVMTPQASDEMLSQHPKPGNIPERTNKVTDNDTTIPHATDSSIGILGVCSQCRSNGACDSHKCSRNERGSRSWCTEKKAGSSQDVPTDYSFKTLGDSLQLRHIQQQKSLKGACNKPDEELLMHLKNTPTTSSHQDLSYVMKDPISNQYDALLQDESEDCFFDVRDVFVLERNSDRESDQNHSHHKDTRKGITTLAEERLTNDQHEELFEVFFDAPEMLFPNEEDDGPKLANTNVEEKEAHTQSLESKKTENASPQISSYPDTEDDTVASNLEAANVETMDESCSGVVAPTSAAAEEESAHSEEHVYCYCETNDRTPKLREETVKLAVRNYAISEESDPETLVNLLKSQPCSEDIIVAFDELARVFRVDVEIDLSSIIQEFGRTRGSHTGRTPLMSACCHGNDVMMEELLMCSDTDINATDLRDHTPLHHVFLNAKGKIDERRRMAEKLRERQQSLQAKGADLNVCPTQDFPGYFLPGPTKLDDQEHLARRNLSRLCQLAFTHDYQRLEDLAPLFDQDISFRCCNDSCRLLLFPDEVYPHSGSNPQVIFHQCWANNRDVFLSIERGECLCLSTWKFTVSFLPACAAAAAGNVELFRRMLESFVSRVQMYSSEHCQGDGGRYGDIRPNLKVGGAACSGGRRTVRKQLRVCSSMAVFHGDRLLAQALCHMMYANQSREVLRVLDDPQIKSVIRLTDESKMSLVDLSLRLGYDSVFWELIERFGPNIQSDSSGMTPLLLLVSWGETHMAHTLLTRGARRGLQARNGQSALKIALQLQNKEVHAFIPTESTKMALMLLEEGEGQTDPEDPASASALQLAIVYSCCALIDMLVERGEVTIPEVSSQRVARRRVEQVLWQPAVSWCTLRSVHYSMAHYLIDKGLDCFTPVVNSHHSAREDSMTPLQALSVQTSKQALTLMDLLIEKGADVNERTHKGFTPLVLAVKHSKVIAKLICAGAILDSPNPDDFTHNKEVLQRASLNESRYVSIQNGSESLSTQNIAGSTSTQNGSGSMSTQNGSGSASTQAGSEPTSNEIGSGYTSTQNSWGSLSTQNGSGSVSTQNGSGSTSTQNDSGCTSIQSGLRSSSTQNGADPMSTQNSSRSTSRITSNIRVSSSAQSSSGSAQAGNSLGYVSQQNSSRSLLEALDDVSRSTWMQNSSFLLGALQAKQYKVAEMALVAGYRVHREPWYAKGEFPEQTPQDVIHTLERISRQPMALTSLCRRTIRESVGSRLPEYLRQVRPPQSVADFIAMKDLVEEYLK